MATSPVRPGTSPGAGRESRAPRAGAHAGSAAEVRLWLTVPHPGELEHGTFSYQLILDNGVQEALIMPTADAAKVLRDLIHDADALYWDQDKQVIIFGKID